MRRAQRRKYHFIYKTTCLITNRYYCGMHSTDNLDDGYLGSGKRLCYSINKHGKENHKREILEYLPSREKLKEREEKIVNEELRRDPLCMNLMNGGQGGKISDEYQIKRSRMGGEAYSRRLNTDKKFYEYIKQYRIKGGRNLHDKLENNENFKEIYGNKISLALSNKFNNDVEYKKFRSKLSSDIMKELHKKGKFKYNNFQGKHHSTNSKKKISDSMSNRFYITDGKTVKMIKQDSVIPDGWKKGRK